MGEMDELEQASTIICQRHASIDVLIHNAGALDDAFSTNSRGIEMTVASQVLGPFMLTHFLAPALRKRTPSRVLWVTSGGLYGEALVVHELNMTSEDYNGVKAYAKAKRAQVTLVEMLATRLEKDHVFVHAMHPGWADTPGVQKSLPMFRQIMNPSSVFIHPTFRHPTRKKKALGLADAAF